MNETVQPAAPETGRTGGRGVVAGVVALVLSFLSLLFLALLFVPLGLIFGIFALVRGLKRGSTGAAVMGGLAALICVFSIFTSPSFWFLTGTAVVGTAIYSHSSPPPKASVIKPKPSPVLAPVPVAETLEGTARVENTATLVVNGRTLALADVLPTDKTQAAILQDFLRIQGENKVACARKAPAKRWTCKTPKGIDVAEAAILNGAAKAAPDASAQYRKSEAEARARNAGIWK